MIDRQSLVSERLRKLTAEFRRYVDAYDTEAPFDGDQLTSHRRTIALLRQAGNAHTAVTDERFVASLRWTLNTWGIGNRRSYLVDEDTFAAALRAVAPALAELEPLAIDTLAAPDEVAERLWDLMNALGVVMNTAKLVAGTKTLHHLLPELVVPMDRAWTGSFFGLQTHEWQQPRYQRQMFRRVYGHFAALARQVDPQQFVTDADWRTSRTKVLDNALIAFSKRKLANRPAEPATKNNVVSFEVAGYPPLKNEAKSVLADGHRHADRVRALLLAAQQARDTQRFTPVSDGPIAMEVVVRLPRSGHPPDLTNCLGGIADVLQHPHVLTDVAWLGELAAVWLYANDRQITAVDGRIVQASEPSYRVLVRSVTGTTGDR